MVNVLHGDTWLCAGLILQKMYEYHQVAVCAFTSNKTFWKLGNVQVISGLTCVHESYIITLLQKWMEFNFDKYNALNYTA